MNHGSDKGPNDAPARGKPSSSSRFLWLVVACFVAVMFWQRYAPIRSAVAWETDMQAAMRAADAENKPILINFSSPSCGYCRKMEAEVFPLPAVLAEIEHFVAVKINTPSHAELAARYDVGLLPTFVVSFADGRPVVMAEGYHEPREFIDFLRRAAVIAQPQ